MFFKSRIRYENKDKKYESQLFFSIKQNLKRFNSVYNRNVILRRFSRRSEFDWLSRVHKKVRRNYENLAGQYVEFFDLRVAERPRIKED